MISRIISVILGCADASEISGKSGSGSSGSSSGSGEESLKIRATITACNWHSDGKDEALDCGTFELDSVVASGPPGIITIKAIGLPYTSQIRQTKQSKGWEKYKLSGIANEMASKNGMAAQFLAKKDPEYKRVEQYRCSDIDFLQQLCHECATLKGLDYRNTAKISRILLFDDIHTASAWRILDNFTKISVEHILTERVKQNKSLVDIKLTARACQEHYQNHVDSFIIVSSDSDYWGLISSLPEARFLVMVEREKCSHAMKQALAESGIFYCYIDDFYSGNADGIKMSALFKEMYRYLDHSIHLNVNDMFAEALRITRLTTTEAEKRQFYDKYIRPMHLVIDSEGNVSIELKR